MVTLDLEGAYFYITIAPEHHHFLGLPLEIITCQYTALPFGISAAARIFTKVMVVTVVYLRLKEIVIFLYINDCLLWHHQVQNWWLILTIPS